MISDVERQQIRSQEERHKERDNEACGAHASSAILCWALRGFLIEPCGCAGCWCQETTGISVVLCADGQVNCYRLLMTLCS